METQNSDASLFIWHADQKWPSAHFVRERESALRHIRPRVQPRQWDNATIRRAFTKCS